MDHITFSKQEAFSVARQFLESDFRVVCDGFLHPSRSALAFDLEGHPTRDDADERIDRFLLEKVVETFYEFAKTARWCDGDMQEYESILEDFLHFQMPPGCAGLKEVDPEKLSVLWDIYRARKALEAHEDAAPTVDFRDIALAGGLAEETVRVATFGEGEHRLQAVSPGNVAMAEAKRWLKVKNRYLPVRFDYPREYSPKKLIDSALALRNWLQHQIQQVGLDLADAAQALGIEHDLIQSFDAFLTGNIRNLDGELPALTPSVVAKAGQLFNIDPEWIAKCVMAIRSDTNTRQFITSVQETVRTHSSETTIDGEPNADEPLNAVNATRLLEQCAWVGPHPQQAKSNKKMNGYMLKSGKTITHQHELKKQYIWIPEALFTKPFESFEYRRYPSADLHKDGNYGRHSGLLKYSDIAEADLVRINVTTTAELWRLLALLK